MASEDERKKKKKRKQKMEEKKNNGKKGKDEKKPVTIVDERFASAQSDPRFMEAPRKRTKVEIDSRFSRIFTDKSFTSSNAPIDKRGRPVDAKSKAASLKHYYRIKEDEEDEKSDRIEADDEEEDSDEDDSESEKLKEEETDFNKQSSEDDDDEASSASDTASSEDEEEVEEEEDADTFLQPEHVPEIDKETRRLAVVNLDWGQVRAVDLYVLLSSFLPKGGQITSVAVYPSEFGLKRMEEEAVRGPVGLFEDDEYGQDDEEDEENIKKKIRAYELSRLRYYFAVVECDSSATADYLYNSCDGVEFERSANKLDLRFIPDSMEFKHEPRDVATEVPAGYEGLDFQTRALQHSNVQLTWDEDEPQRIKTLKRKLNEEQLADLELKEFLASDDGETDDNDSGSEGDDRSSKKDQKKDKYRALLETGNGSGEDDEEEDKQDMEVTFNSGLEDLSKRILEKDKKSETVWEATLRKRNEKRKARKRGSKYSSEDDSSDSDQEIPEQDGDFFDDEPSAKESKKNQSVNGRKKNSNRDSTQETEATGAELELLLADDNEMDTNVKGYNLKPKKSKNKKGKTLPDEGKIPDAVYNDPRFSALLSSPLFALDPTDPQFKRSAVYARQVIQKQKMGTQENIEPADYSAKSEQPSLPGDEWLTNKESYQRKENNELSSMVKSLKMKSKQVQKASQKNKNLLSKAKMRK